MKNLFEVIGDTTIMSVTRRDGTHYEVLIDTEDLPKVQSFGRSWCYVRTSERKEYVYSNLPLPDNKKRTVYLHRWILGEPEGVVIDHINGNSFDNRKANLRPLTNAQNQQNRLKANKTSTSGIRGVTWRKKDKKWYAYIKVNGKKMSVGFYDDIEKAREAVEKARRKHMPYSQEALAK